MGRVYAITGASGALGSAVAKAAEEQGARVALIDHARTPPTGLASGDDVLVLGGVDLTDAVAAGAAIDAIPDRFGGLDALLNIAGGFRFDTLETSLVDGWYRLFLIHLQNAANANPAATPLPRHSPAGPLPNVT